jgi:exopolysaccharide biosynthesis polyprenyl glycosylphosphotransferase
MPTSPICEVVVAHDVRKRSRVSVRSLLHQYYLRRALSTLFLVALDVGVVYLAVALAPALWRPFGTLVQTPLPSEVLVSMLVAVGVAACMRMYGQREQRSGLGHIIRDGVIVLFVLAAVIMFTHKSITTHSAVFIWLTWLAVRYVVRFVYDHALVLRYGHTNVRRPAVVVGTAELCQRVADSFAASPAARDVRINGMVTAEDSAQSSLFDEEIPVTLRRLGGLDDLDEVVAATQPMELIIADPDLVRGRMVPILELCRRERLTLRMAARNIVLAGDSVSFAPGFDMPVFLVTSPAHGGADYVAKRVLDVFVSALGLLVLSPVVALIALAIKITSPGPVLYVSSRVGLGQKPFRLFKFRTMYRNARAMQEELESLNEADGAIFKIHDDPRVTSVGRILRRSGLDELPQLLNVLRGDMSLVGPRPLPARDNHLLDDWHKRRHVVLPGLTGLWQISGRSRLSFEKMIELDFRYIDAWSFRSDLAILFRTALVVLTGRGGY